MGQVDAVSRLWDSRNRRRFAIRSSGVRARLRTRWLQSLRTKVRRMFTRHSTIFPSLMTTFVDPGAANVIDGSRRASNALAYPCCSCGCGGMRPCDSYKARHGARGYSSRYGDGRVVGRTSGAESQASGLLQIFEDVVHFLPIGFFGNQVIFS